MNLEEYLTFVIAYIMPDGFLVDADAEAADDHDYINSTLEELQSTFYLFGLLMYNHN